MTVIAGIADVTVTVDPLLPVTVIAGIEDVGIIPVTVTLEPLAEAVGFVAVTDDVGTVDCEGEITGWFTGWTTGSLLELATGEAVI